MSEAVFGSYDLTLEGSVGEASYLPLTSVTWVLSLAELPKQPPLVLELAALEGLRLPMACQPPRVILNSSIEVGEVRFSTAIHIA